MPRSADAVITPNVIFTAARKRLPSPRRPGQYISRPELAEAVNRALDHLYPDTDLESLYVLPRWVGKLERGESRWPVEERRAALREVFGVKTDMELDLYSPRQTNVVSNGSAELEKNREPVDRGRTIGEEVFQAVPDDRGQRFPAEWLSGRWHVAGGGSHLNGEVSSGSPEDLVDVLARIQRITRAVDPLVISGMEDGMSTMLVEYETWDRDRFLTSLIKKRRFVDGLVGESMWPTQRKTLYGIAAKISGLLGYVEVGRENFPLARAYCTESFSLADLAEDSHLRAWARGMQSFCEYYAGDYKSALEIAVDGLTYAGSGPQSVRLTINGVARAMGKLGDCDGVDRTVEHAYRLMSKNSVPDGMPSSVSLGCYSSAQTAGNAVTAYVALGNPNRVQEYANLASPGIQNSASQWSRSLLQIDLATSTLSGKDCDLYHASSSVVEALRLSSGRPIISIYRRAFDFAMTAERRWGKIQAISNLRQELEAWRGG
jgi:hypothetical protein